MLNSQIKILNEDSKIYILSPHLDDTFFSIGGVLAVLSKSIKKIKNIVIFSHDQYVIKEYDAGVKANIALRKNEENMNCRSIGISPVYLDYEAAYPGRGYANWNDPIDEKRDASLIEDLSKKIREELGSVKESLIFAPLSIGGHIDHRIVNRIAAGFKNEGFKVVFYEDLPYAADQKFWMQVDNIKILDDLKGIPFDITEVISIKKEFANTYKSQITSEEINILINYSSYRRSVLLEKWYPELKSESKYIEMLWV